MLALLSSIMLMPNLLLKRKSQPHTMVFNPIQASTLTNTVTCSSDRFIFVHVSVSTKEMILGYKFATKPTVQQSM